MEQGTGLNWKDQEGKHLREKQGQRGNSSRGMVTQEEEEVAGREEEEEDEVVRKW